MCRNRRKWPVCGGIVMLFACENFRERWSFCHRPGMDLDISPCWRSTVAWAMLNEQTLDSHGWLHRVVLGVMKSTRSGGGPASVSLLLSKHWIKIKNAPNQELQLTAVACISWSSLFLSSKIMKGKISLCWNTNIMKTYGGVEVKLHTLFNFALKMIGDDHRNDLVALSPEKKAWTGGLPGPQSWCTQKS